MNTTQQPALSPYNRLHPNPDVLAQRMGADVILLHLRTNRFYELNHTSARLWELLTAGKTVTETYAQLLQDFDVEPTQLAHELTTMLATMQQADLVKTDA